LGKEGGQSRPPELSSPWRGFGGVWGKRRMKDRKIAAKEDEKTRKRINGRNAGPREKKKKE